MPLPNSSRFVPAFALTALLLGVASGRAQMPIQIDRTPATSNVMPPAFETVSIKENKGNSGEARIMRMMYKPNGFESTNLPVLNLIAQAYGIRQEQIFGAPDWVGSTPFDINAKVADEDVPTFKKLTGTQRSGMFLDIFKERFKLQAHTETKTLPVYELVADKGGPKLTESTAPPMTSFSGEKPPQNTKFSGMFRMGPGAISGTGITMTALCNQLSYALHRTVIDKTGLPGKYDVELKWTPEEKLAAGTDNGSDDQAGSLFTVVREQLGLKLVSNKGPVETLVIDHIEKPSEN